MPDPDACSDSFEEYVGQLQMATIASIQVELGGNREIRRTDITDRLRPLQQVRKATVSSIMCQHLQTSQAISPSSR